MNWFGGLWSSADNKGVVGKVIMYGEEEQEEQEERDEHNEQEEEKENEEEDE